MKGEIITTGTTAQGAEACFMSRVLPIDALDKSFHLAVHTEVRRLMREAGVVDVKTRVEHATTEVIT